jgi:hypothetical protein
LDGGSARRKAATYTHNSTNTEKTHTQTSIPSVGFEHTISVFEREKTVHALDRAATVIGEQNIRCGKTVNILWPVHIFKYPELLKNCWNKYR